MEKNLKVRIFKIYEKYSGYGDFLAYSNVNGVIEIANKAAVCKYGIINNLKEAINILENEGYVVKELQGKEINEWIELDLTGGKIYDNYVVVER